MSAEKKKYGMVSQYRFIKLISQGNSNMYVSCKCLMLLVISLCAMQVSAMQVSEPGRPTTESQYWSWGWGTYGSGRNSIPVEDVARYDWSLICFGNESPCKGLADWCNEISRLNPKHKFVIRTWGYTDNNGFMDYLYKPGTKEMVQEHIRKQIRFMLDNLSKPENIVGLCFQEELPTHFSQGMEKDAALYPAEVKKELGEIFDVQNERHREWYGKKWVQVMDDINRLMKEVSGGRQVYYYQLTNYSCLDDWDAWHELDPDLKKYSFNRDKAKYLPFRHGDIVKPGYCDGIFGYSRVDWNIRTARVVEKLNCGLFSQVSTCPGMRSCSLEKTIETARWNNPNNKGTFIFINAGRKENGSWALAYQTDKTTFWTIGDHLRHLGWKYKIGMDVVKQILSPKVILGYDAEGVKAGDSFKLRAIVQNRRTSSWFGGDAKQAELQDVRATVEVPEGFSVVSPELPVKIGAMPGGDCQELVWTVRRDKDIAAGTTGGSFRVTLTGQSTDGKISGTGEGLAPANRLPSQLPQIVDRSGYSWIEPAIPKESNNQELVLYAFEGIDSPKLLRHDGAMIRYKGSLRPNCTLRLGPGGKAILVAAKLSDKTKHFDDRSRDGEYVVDSGYHFFTCRFEVSSGETPILRLTGRAEDGNILVTLVYSGTVDGKPYKKDYGGVVNGILKNTETVVDAKLPVAPRFDGGHGKAALFLYRIKSAGTLFLKSLDIVSDGTLQEGVDVSGDIEGEFPAPIAPFTRWTLQFENDPTPNNNRMVSAQFVSTEPAGNVNDPLKQKRRAMTTKTSELESKTKKDENK